MYEQLADLLARRIDDGQLAGGARLANEFELARDFAVSRHTVREALALLERRGLIRRRRGKGTFVVPPRVSQDLTELRSFYGGLLDRGVLPKMELLEFRPVTAPPFVAELFGGDDVMQLRRRYLVDGRPLAVADIYLHPMTRTLSWELAERHDTYTLLERYLETPVARAAVAIRADAADRAAARALDVPGASPVLVLAQTQYGVDGRVLVYSELRMRPEAYEFRIDLPSGTGLRDGLAMTAVPGPSRRRP